MLMEIWLSRCFMTCTQESDGGQLRYKLHSKFNFNSLHYVKEKGSNWDMVKTYHYHPHYHLLWQNSTHDIPWKASIPRLPHYWQLSQTHPLKTFMTGPGLAWVPSNPQSLTKSPTRPHINDAYPICSTTICSLLSSPWREPDMMESFLPAEMVPWGDAFQSLQCMLVIIPNRFLLALSRRVTVPSALHHATKSGIGKACWRPIVFKGLLWSSLWVPEGVDWDRDQSTFVLELQETGPDYRRPKTTVFCSLWTSLGLNWS